MFFLCTNTFCSALTLLVGWQEEHPCHLELCLGLGTRGLCLGLVTLGLDWDTESWWWVGSSACVCVCWWQSVVSKDRWAGEYSAASQSSVCVCMLVAECGVWRPVNSWILCSITARPCYTYDLPTELWWRAQRFALLSELNSARRTPQLVWFYLLCRRCMI